MSASRINTFFDKMKKNRQMSPIVMPMSKNQSATRKETFSKDSTLSNVNDKIKNEPGCEPRKVEKSIYICFSSSGTPSMFTSLNHYFIKTLPNCPHDILHSFGKRTEMQAKQMGIKYWSESSFQNDFPCISHLFFRTVCEQCQPSLPSIGPELTLCVGTYSNDTFNVAGKVIELNVDFKNEFIQRHDNYILINELDDEYLMTSSSSVYADLLMKLKSLNIKKFITSSSDKTISKNILSKIAIDLIYWDPPLIDSEVELVNDFANDTNDDLYDNLDEVTSRYAVENDDMEYLVTECEPNVILENETYLYETNEITVEKMSSNEEVDGTSENESILDTLENNDVFENGKLQFSLTTTEDEDTDSNSIHETYSQCQKKSSLKKVTFCDQLREPKKMEFVKSVNLPGVDDAEVLQLVVDDYEENLVGEDAICYTLMQEAIDAWIKYQKINEFSDEKTIYWIGQKPVHVNEGKVLQQNTLAALVEKNRRPISALFYDVQRAFISRAHLFTKRRTLRIYEDDMYGDQYLALIL